MKLCASSILLGAMFLAVAARTATADGLPDSKEVIDRMLKRSQEIAKDDKAPQYCYKKHSLVEQLDSNGHAIKTTEKLYDVTLIKGYPFDRLVKVQGKPLSEAELAKEQKREEDFKKRISGQDPKKNVEEDQPMVTRDLMNHFEFKVVKRESVNDRQTLQVDFAAKPSTGKETVGDKILSHLKGTVWVDEQCAEIAKLDLRLTEGFSLGLLGMLGSLNECSLKMNRKPLSDGSWVNEVETIQIGGRKLFSSMHFRSTETSSGFEISKPAQ